MQFGHIELFCSEPRRTMAFYREVLGFELTAVQGDQLIWLRKGPFELLLRPGSPRPAASYEESAIGLVLYVDQLEHRLQEFIERGLVIKGTVDSEKCYTFTDPDGHWFQLVDPNDH